MRPIGFLIAIVGLVWCACGVVGSPVAPEDVGVAPIIERQKRQEAERAAPEPPGSPVNVPGLRAGEGDPLRQPDELPVPPLQSVGTKP